MERCIRVRLGDSGMKTPESVPRRTYVRTESLSRLNHSSAPLMHSGINLTVAASSRSRAGSRALIEINRSFFKRRETILCTADKGKRTDGVAAIVHHRPLTIRPYGNNSPAYLGVPINFEKPTSYVIVRGVGVL